MSNACITCDYDCLNCVYSECIDPELSYEELRQSEIADNQILKERKNSTQVTQRVIKDGEEIIVITTGVDMTRYIRYSDRTDLEEYLTARDKEYDLKRYWKNPEKFRKKSRDRYHKNRKSRLETAKAYYKEHRELKKAYSRQYYAKHKEEINRKRREQRRLKKNGQKGTES